MTSAIDVNSKHRGFLITSYMCEEEQNPEKPEDVRDNGRKAFPREYNHRREATVYDAVAGKTSP